MASVISAATRGARPAGYARPDAHALLINADDVRDEVADGQWSAAAQDAVEKVSSAEINRRLADQFGDSFWDAMHAAYADVIREICDDANIPPEDR